MRMVNSKSKLLWFAVDDEEKIVKIFFSKVDCLKHIKEIANERRISTN